MPITAGHAALARTAR
uniref:Uncharacterized protein n=1 Tax=Arundo donax TaxID=35708 RepID=A0A0A9ELE7_ARUDO